MRLLLDTCTFLWIASDSPELSSRAREIFRRPDNDVYLSAASTWEISVKHGLGRLPLPGAPETYVPELRQRHGIEPLAVNEEATLYLSRLPTLHRDPFDRMLVCQANVEGMVILTPDELITQYPVRSMW
ncbi:MAG: type II toxin-antitoxin system VapC family toxin [Vicinamibacteria bacterium]